MTADGTAQSTAGSTAERSTEDTTEKVRAIWCRELRRDDVSADDDFFALGGQSLIMARIQGAFIEELGAEVPIDQMYLNPTVASIASYIASMDAMTP